jgi:hypothetical protein
MRRIWKLLVVLFAASLVLLACGGDDDDSDGASADVGADAGDDDGELDAHDLAAFSAGDCGDVARAMGTAMAGAAASVTGSSTDLESAVDDLDAYVDRLPDEIQGDMQIVVDAFSDYVAAFAEVGYDASSGKPPTEEQMAALQELSEQFDEERVDEAAENVEAWLQAECGK